MARSVQHPLGRRVYPALGHPATVHRASSTRLAWQELETATKGQHDGGCARTYASDTVNYGLPSMSVLLETSLGDLVVRPPSALLCAKPARGLGCRPCRTPGPT